MTKKSAVATEPDPVSCFEASLQELESIVARMESGELPLEDSLKLFERGVALTKTCRDSLTSAELRVKKLLADAKADPEANPALNPETDSDS